MRGELENIIESSRDKSIKSNERYRTTLITKGIKQTSKLTSENKNYDMAFSIVKYISLSISQLEKVGSSLSEFLNISKPDFEKLEKIISCVIRVKHILELSGECFELSNYSHLNENLNISIFAKMKILSKLLDVLNFLIVDRLKLWKESVLLNDPKFIHQDMLNTLKKIVLVSIQNLFFILFCFLFFIF